MALTRTVEVPIFGVYALAFAIVKLSSVIAEFGLGDAFLHRAPETEDEDLAAAVHFGLTVPLTLLWSGILILTAMLATQPPLRTALVVLTVTVGVLQLARTPTLVLVRQVRHRRLAVIEVLTAVSTTVVAVWLAYHGAELWALLATDIVTAAIAVIAFYLWRPPWRVGFSWLPATVRYYLGFGSRSFVAGVLSQLLERLDTLWTALFLGTTALGFYSRAFTFATYPRRFVTRPILDVIAGIYAELKGDIPRLNRAFEQINALLLRIGLSTAGLIAVVAPELVSGLLGERWTPIVPPFRILLILAIAAPTERSLAHLFVAVGRPGEVVRARAIQLALMLAGLLVLGPLWGISGVAAAVAGAAVVSVCLLLRWARDHVEFRFATIAAPPLLALGVATVAAVMVRGFSAPLENPLLTFGLVTSTFVVVDAGVLVSLDRRRLFSLVETLSQLVGSR